VFGLGLRPFSTDHDEFFGDSTIEREPRTTPIVHFHLANWCGRVNPGNCSCTVVCYPSLSSCYPCVSQMHNHPGLPQALSSTLYLQKEYWFLRYMNLGQELLCEGFRYCRSRSRSTQVSRQSGLLRTSMCIDLQSMTLWEQARLTTSPYLSRVAGVGVRQTVHCLLQGSQGSWVGASRLCPEDTIITVRDIYTLR
jgi:hypothetical protein